ncbi:MAG: rhomboid family intramembrane serine protease [Fluviicola sp.]
MNNANFNISQLIKTSPVYVKLILINVAVFFLIHAVFAFERLTGKTELHSFGILDSIFTLSTRPIEILFKPWTVVTSIFAHYDFMHLLMNMLFFYLSSKIFKLFFSDRRLIHVYILGGIAGGLFEVLIRLFIPDLADAKILGASGAIMAVFTALAFHRPMMKVSVFILEVPLILLVGLFILSDFINIGTGDHTAHFAHLGGALIGFLSVRNLHSSKNIINFSEKTTAKIKVYFSNMFKSKPKMKVEKGERTAKTDEQFNAEKKLKQDEINKILDKISKSGYDSLSKAEKEFLFSQSNKR